MEKLKNLFGKVDHIRSMQLEAELTALSPDDFSTIIDYLTKFKELLTQLKGSGKKKEDKDCVYLILSKLRGPFQIFASTFLSTMDALGTNFTLPSLEEFCERLTREEIKLSTLESSTSSSKALVASTPKGKGKSKAQSKPTPTSPKPTQNEPKSKAPSTKKEKSNTTCTYCKKEGHPATRCWKKLQDLEETMKKIRLLPQKSMVKPLMSKVGLLNLVPKNGF